MTEGDIVLAALQQADGTYKKRPVLVLRIMPRFNDFLICGKYLHTISSNETHGMTDSNLFIINSL